MPVWLDAIPQKAPAVARPGTRRWLLLLTGMLLGGSSLTLWGWPAERTGLVFWFTALGLPLCTWGLLFSLRRFAYKAQQCGAASRNGEREALIAREIHRGQRCAWILGRSVQHVAGIRPDALLTALNNAIPFAEPSVPRGGGRAVRYAALSQFQADTDAALTSLSSTLAARAQNTVAQLPAGLPGWLLLDCDDDIRPELTPRLLSALTEATGRTFRATPGQGLAAFDGWLDTRYETPGLLVSVVISLPASPAENDADAITMVILSNRAAAAYPSAACLHRPECGTPAALAKTLQRALLWAAIKLDILSGGWVSGPQLTQGGDWSSACEAVGTTFSLAEHNRSPDTVLGYAGRASPWLAIILAEAVAGSEGAQVIAVQPAADQDAVWVMAVTQHDTLRE